MLSRRLQSVLDFALASQHVYQPGDTIEGDVVFHPPGDVILHEPCITLEGTARTVLWDPELERRSGGACVAHTFLQLQQPFEATSPETTLQPKTTHLFSFALELPLELPPRACRHPCSSSDVHDSHLRLPPSFPGKGPRPGNLDPSRVTIAYTVRFRAMAVHPDSKQDLYRIDRSHEVVVCMPPVPVRGPEITSDMGLVTKEIVLRDLGRRTGRLTATAGEPKPIHLEEQRTTLLPIYLRFYPESTDRLPPRPHKAHTKLEATTYFGTKPYTTWPDHDGLSARTRQQRAFKKHVALSSRDVHVTWTALSAQKKDSHDEGCYTACLALPVVLPGAVVPSFYSCLVARVYAVCVEVSFHSHLVSSTVSLRVPVHII